MTLRAGGCIPQKVKDAEALMAATPLRTTTTTAYLAGLDVLFDNTAVRSEFYGSGVWRDSDSATSTPLLRSRSNCSRPWANGPCGAP